MIKIKRIIDKSEHEFALTAEEVGEVIRQYKILRAKEALEKYSDVVAYYDSIVCDDELLLQFANLLEKKICNNCEKYEIESINEIFGILGFSPLDNTLLEILDKEGMIPAIKKCREVMETGLKEAKEYCENLRDQRAYILSDNTTLEGRVKFYIRKGEFIKAVKLYREETGTGLKEAKEYCDKLRTEMGIAVVSLAI